ncbi:class F sortase [Actinobacteria bacterium YIM 96077]|uniref:Class F sortase n=1 Tax=Phytoactinopolyspora halophila TaxID=1981511 RepID=A0A329QF90_9ACTN|nr:class F sortase [Phytoactinopolyspora halophila]AYY14049.1 class F sortase [Actinobacteria bacterium YIM 96077]RAW10956.1 hypothetical protein DPM12_17755 [Phytoactinopolyspora halophila]
MTEPEAGGGPGQQAGGPDGGDRSTGPGWSGRLGPLGRLSGPVKLSIGVAVAAAIVTGTTWAVSDMLAEDDSSSGSFGASERDQGDDEPRDDDGSADEPDDPDHDPIPLYQVWIPGVGVRAPVVAAESEDRVLEPPDDPLVAGWWSEGAAPGDDDGTVLLVGHSLDEGEAVFDGVAGLDEGDTIMVSGDATLVYQVSVVESIDPDELADRAEELFGQDGEGRLVIVTCDDWDGDTFESNVVVTATPM